MNKSKVVTPNRYSFVVDDEPDVNSLGEWPEIDWGAGSDEEVTTSCDLENPESCESCQ